MSNPTPQTSLTKSSDIGMKQLKAIANIPFAARLDLITEGLPILFTSAQTLHQAHRNVGSDTRAGQILLGGAIEEAAKILILIDYVRCPPNLKERAQGQLSAFYNHGARLLYAQACSWRPDTVATLRGYVDRTRASHYIEGSYGEYIIPNWDLYTREARLYADLTRTDTGVFAWNDPDAWPVGHLGFDLVPAALGVAGALSRVGAFTRPGLQIVHDTWGAQAFQDAEHAQTSDALIRTTLEKLIIAELPSEEASDEDVSRLYAHWQMPMYAIDVQPRSTDLESLRAEQEAQARNLY